MAELPPGTLLLVTSPGAAVTTGSGGTPAGPPHLMTVVVSGPGFADGLLTSPSTRRPGIVTLTDLTPTVAGWLGRAVPAGTVGARIGRTSRGDLAGDDRGRCSTGTPPSRSGWPPTAGSSSATRRPTRWRSACPPCSSGAAEERRRARARCWRVAGALAAAVPLGSYLANLSPWWQRAHPAWWLYGMTVVWTLGGGGAGAGAVAPRPVVSAGGLPHLAPFGAICLATLTVLGVDVMTGSALQLEAPFGLSLLVSGRYYGIGNDVLGVYCVSALVAAAWLGRALPRPPRLPSLPVLAAAGVGLFAVVASGWPGFGAKVGATIALVPCLLLLLSALAGGGGGAGIRVGWRWAVPIAVSGLALFAVFALVSYFVQTVGVSDIGTFAGNLLRGEGGGVLERKVGSNVGTLTVSVVRWLMPVAAVAAGVALWRPSSLRLRTLPRAFAAAPTLRTVAWLCWLALVIGWLADDSGVIVPAAALPFAVPLVVSIAVAVSAATVGGRYLGSAFAAPAAARAGTGGDLPRKYDQQQPPR